jgi:hypothetical protein
MNDEENLHFWIFFSSGRIAFEVVLKIHPALKNRGNKMYAKSNKKCMFGFLFWANYPYFH